MKQYNLIHLGIGNVGKSLVRQISYNRKKLRTKYSIDLNYCALFNSRGGIFHPQGLSLKEINNFPGKINNQVEDALRYIEPPFILIDTTASDKTYSLILTTLKKGGSVVLSNKRPLVRSYSDYKKLNSFGPKKLLFETTVGAGLPVINTLKTLLASGDEIVEITGSLSGTLGFICSSLEQEMSFSESVRAAKEKGFTESDPREDLSGVDVARKTIILARIIGLPVELKDINVQPFYHLKFNKLTVDQFMSKISELDNFYKRKFFQAKKNNQTFRFIAKISQKICSVKLERVDIHGSLGSLKGPDNIVVFKTIRYFDRPLIIKGPGAGPEVTAAGVFGDILQITGVI